MSSTKEAPTRKYPRTVGVEPVERLAKVFVMPTIPGTTQATSERILAGLGFAALGPSQGGYIGKAEPVEIGCENGADCVECEQEREWDAKEAPQEPSSDDLLTGIKVQLQFLDQGDLRRAHELEQFKRGQEAERECELYALCCEIADATLDDEVTFEDICNLDGRDVLHTAINRVSRNLGYDD